MELLIGDGSTYHFWMVVLAFLLIFAGLVRLVGKNVSRSESTLLWLVAPVAFAALYVCGILYFEQGTQKMVMPGVYEVNLESTGYGAFNFWRWPSKGVEEIADQAHIAIFDTEGKLVQPLPWPPPRTLRPRYFSNVGREEYQIKIPKSGRYTVVCEDKRVVLLVPFRNYDDPMSNETVTGAGDDFNFVTPVALGKTAATGFLQVHEPADQMVDLIGKRITLQGSIERAGAHRVEFKPGFGNKSIFFEPLRRVQESGFVHAFINSGHVEKTSGAVAPPDDEASKLQQAFASAVSGHDMKHVIVKGKLCRIDSTVVNGSRTQKEMEEFQLEPSVPLSRYVMPLEEIEVFTTGAQKIRICP